MSVYWVLGPLGLWSSWLQLVSGVGMCWRNGWRSCPKPLFSDVAILQQMWNIVSRLMAPIEALKYGRPRPGIAVYAVLPWTLITESPAFWLKI